MQKWSTFIFNLKLVEQSQKVASAWNSCGVQNEYRTELYTITEQ